MKKNNKTKVLFFANIPVADEERSIGGATVLAKTILDFLQSDKRIEIKHQQIRRFWRNKLQLLDYFFWIFKFPFSIKNFDVVSFHGTKDFHFTIAPLLWVWAKLFRKKVVYHFFGGNFHEQYQEFSPIFKWIIKKTILKSDTLFFETKQMISFFEKEGINNIVWLPNSRKPLIKDFPKKEFANKFVFISRVIPQKGINEIIKAAEFLPNDYIIDIYGPIDDRHYSKDVFLNGKASYKGLLKPEEVVSTLLKYDVLLLPSYFDGEGYPGIIIESLALGMPVITTHWKALSELIINNVNGILIDVKNVAQLITAIQEINIKNYSDFSESAFNSFEQFSSDVVFNKIIDSYIK